MPTKNMNWRSYVKVHPAADLFPMMGQENLQALSDDIRANGLRVPVVYFAARNGERLLLDGRNRLAAMALAGKKPDTDGKDVQEGEVDPYGYVISTNIRRRHLTNAQSRELIAKVIEAQPDKSDRAIAGLLGKSHTTVAKVREANGQAGHNEERKEVSGRKARGRKPRKIRGALRKVDPSQLRNDDAVSCPSSTEPVISDSTPTSDMPAAVVEDSNISTAPSQTSEQTATIEAGHETDASPINGGEATIIAVIATESDQALRQLHLLAEFTKQVDDANDRMITAYATRSLDDASEALLSAVEAAKGFIERAAVESAAH